jgi:hypothetical protein
VAEIDGINDQYNVFNGQINEGDIISGTYRYSPTISDTNSIATVGDYWHDFAPYGFRLECNQFVFQTDPQNVDFLIEIVNDHGYPPSDNYLLRSYNNLPLESGMFVEHIAWQLDDPTLTALTSTDLPSIPPQLDDWQSIAGLTISGLYIYHIRAHVISAKLVPPQKYAYLPVVIAGDDLHRTLRQ